MVCGKIKPLNELWGASHLVMCIALSVGLSTMPAMANEIEGEATQSESQVADAREQLARKFVHRLRSKLGPDTAGTSAGFRRVNSGMVPGEVLFLRVKAGRFVLSEDVYALAARDGMLVALSDLFDILEFPLSVDQERQLAEGKFGEDNRTFLIDGSDGKAKSGSQSFAYDDSQVQFNPDGVFVHTRALEEWLGLKITENFRDLTLDIASERPLPVIRRLEQRYALASRAESIPNEPELDEREIDYELFRPPFVDVQTNATLFDRPESPMQRQLSYSVIAGGEVGYATSEVFVSGRDEETINQVRATLERESLDNDMLGVLRASYVGVGDVITAQLPLTDTGQQERGVRISNTPVGRSTLFETIPIEGDVPPGTDVELYRNGALIDFQQVEADGRYDFGDVELFVGRNDFELVFYDPSGTIRREKRSVPLNGAGLDRGEVQYEVSVSQDERVMYRRDKQPDTGGLNASARLTTGVSRGMSVSAGALTTEVNGDRVSAAEIGLTSSYLNSFVTGSFLYDSTGGMAATGTGSRAFGQHAIRGRFDWFNDFALNGSAENALEKRGQFDVSGPLLGVFGRQIRYNVRSEYDEFSSGALNAEVDADISVPVLGGLFASGASYSYKEDPEAINRTVYGFSQFTRLLNPVRVRVSTEYQIDPEVELETIATSLNWPVTSDVTTEANIVHERTSGLTEGEFKLNWNSPYAVVSPRVAYGTDEELSASLGVRFGLGHSPYSGDISVSSKPLSRTGAVSAFVFLDADGDGKFDEDETPIEDAQISVVQLRKSALTDETGRVFITGLAKNQKTDVKLVSESLLDPLWVPTSPGASITLRPGVVSHFEFPVIQGGEIEGTVTLRDDDGVDFPVRGLEVQLLDESGRVVQKERTSFDGFYVFSGVRPGKYLVVPNTEERKHKRLPPVKQRPVNVADYGALVLEADLTFDFNSAPKPQYTVHLASFRSKFVMAVAWAALKVKEHDLFASVRLLDPSFVDQTEDDHVPLVVGPFESAEMAERVCGQIPRYKYECDAVEYEVATPTYF